MIEPISPKAKHSTNVLISSLGESPAVVTETVDALEREEHIRIHYVVTIGTNAYEVRESQRVLQEEFDQFDGGRVGYYPVQIVARDWLTRLPPSRLAWHRASSAASIREAGVMPCWGIAVATPALMVTWSV